MVFCDAVFGERELAHVRAMLARSQACDGRGSAAGAAGAVKRNQQFDLSPADTGELTGLVVNALRSHMGFFRAALPAEISQPMINCYRPGMAYGPHFDSPSFVAPGGARVRADLSATLFLTPPGQYEGGELVIWQDGASEAVKGEAGQLVVYPASQLHEVTEVRSGTRHAVVFWIQSMIRRDDERLLFYRLDKAIEDVSRELPNSQAVRDLTGVFSGLGRLWMEP